MTKLQTWNAAQTILSQLNLSKAKNEEASRLFALLLEPKKGGGTRALPKDIDGVLHYHCRYTNLYFPKSEMIYQNDETREACKDKGYSKIGISLWNKGQKYLKDLKMRSVEIAYGDDQSDDEQAKGMKLHKEAKEIETNNSTNDYKWLMENFLSDEQADDLESLE